MSNDLVMEEMFKRFSTYSSPTDVQKKFLELYKNKSNLLPVEIKLLNSTVKILKNIDTLAKEKNRLAELDKSARLIERKNDAHIKILVGSALIAGMKSDDDFEKFIFDNSFNDLIKRKFIQEKDVQKIKDYLAELDK